MAEYYAALFFRFDFGFSTNRGRFTPTMIDIAYISEFTTGIYSRGIMGIR